MNNNDPRNAHISETVTIPLRDFAVAMELVRRLLSLPAHPNALGSAARLLLKYHDLDAVREQGSDDKSCARSYREIAQWANEAQTVAQLAGARLGPHVWRVVLDVAKSAVLRMTLNDYQQEMSRTYKPDRKTNHALGVAGECAECAEIARTPESFNVMVTAGRICDAVKKEEYHKLPADREAMLKELGDVLWYTAATATDYGLTLEDVARANVEKLKARYPQGFVPGGGAR